MKHNKLLLTLATMLLCVGNLWADTVTFDFADYKKQGTTSTGSDYTMNDKAYVAIGDTKFFGNNNQAHFYAGGTITVTPKNGSKITKITIYTTSTSYNGYESNGTYTPSTGNVAQNTSDNTIVEWTGSATSAFTIDHTKQIRWTSIVVTYTSVTKYNISVDKTIVGGRVTATPNPAEENETITLTATPNNHYMFSSWVVTNAQTSAAITVTNNQFTMPAANVNVSAVFLPIPKYDISVDNTIVGGSVTATPNPAEENETITLTATPNEHYMFSSWVVTNAQTSAAITVTNNQFTMPAANVNVSAVFLPIPKYDISVDNTIVGGSVTATPNPAEENETITLTATPNEHYMFSSWVVTNAQTSAAITVTNNKFTMPAANVNVFAVFRDSSKCIITYTAAAKLQFSQYASFNTAISSHIFSNGNGVITFSNEVTSIGAHAFDGCSGLTSITIPNSVTSIGNYAFEGCTGLTSITIPNSVTSIGNYAFDVCSGLTSVTIPNSVTSIGKAAFYDCSSLTSVTIPNSVTSIGSSAFCNCSGLTSIMIPNSVTSIEKYAFSGCSGLTSVTIPNSVTSIGAWAFDGCSSLTSITIPNSVTSIENYAFYGCSGLTSITCLGSTLPTLGSNVFYQVPSNVLLRIQCTAEESYHQSTVWSKFTNVEIMNKHHISFACDATMGQVLVSDTVALPLDICNGEQLTISAVANEGYRFTQWSDGVTDNPRIEEVVEDVTYEAIFAVDTPTGIIPTKEDCFVQKLFRDGQVLIQRGDRLYDLRGQEVK